jgi:hypothetical protein
MADRLAAQANRPLAPRRRERRKLAERLRAIGAADRADDVRQAA